MGAGPLGYKAPARPSPSIAKFAFFAQIARASPGAKSEAKNAMCVVHAAARIYSGTWMCALMCFKLATMVKVMMTSSDQELHFPMCTWAHAPI